MRVLGCKHLDPSQHISIIIHVRIVVLFSYHTNAAKIASAAENEIYKLPAMFSSVGRSSQFK